MRAVPQRRRGGGVNLDIEWVEKPAQTVLWVDPTQGRTLVLGAGKAGGAMAAAVDALWPADAPLSGLVVTRYDHVPPAYLAQPGRIEVVEAAHPVPDEAGQRAAQRIVALTRGLGPTTWCCA
jgi:glycerate 2-kinase